MKPLKAVKVFRWLSDISYKIYVFDVSTTTVYDDNVTVIKENIYQDDNIEYAATKIAYYISKTDEKIKSPFYIWKKHKPLLFEIENAKWKGYNVNPFKSTDRNAEELKEPISYKYFQGIFNTNHVNITFFSDFAEKNKYYYTDYKTSFPNFIRREQVIKELYNKEVVHTKLISETYHRIDLFTRLKQPFILSNLFHILHTTKDIQLIQLVNDNFRLLYKLYKKHSLSERFLSSVFNIDKMHHQNCINIYSVMSSGTYCKITIDAKGLMTLSYVLDLRNLVNWNDLSHNKNLVMKYINNFAKQKIHLKELNIKVNIYYNIDNSSFAVLSKKIGEYIDVFHVLKLYNEKNKNKIVCIYKRSNNYNKEPINLNEYIKSRLEMGINDKELVQELINLGISENDADNLVKNEIAAINALKYNDLEQKVKIENTGTMVTIEQYKQGYLVDISNCPSKAELNNVIYWISRIIENTRKIVAKKDVLLNNNIPPIIYEKNNSTSKNSVSSNSSSKSTDENIGNIDLDLGSDDDFFQGGALGKQKHGYFMNMLKQADKDLFTENYARNKCQAAFQPLVLSKAEKEDLQKRDLLQYFDNVIEYGSKPNIQNFYTCPRVWCPVSKIPLDYNQENPTCPLENEEPMKLFWNKDRTKPRFVKLTKADENGVSVPCCFKKEAKAPKEQKAVKPKPVVSNQSQSSHSKSHSSTKSIQPIQPIKHDDDKNDKEENYIMNKTAPIPLGRSGLIPASLYKLLFPNMSFALCSKTLNKTQKCLVRHGIQHKTVKKQGMTSKDSILYALAYSLGFKNKKDLIRDITSKLDIVRFLSLENGNVCKDFLDIQAVIPEKNKKLCAKFMKTFAKNSLFDINDLKCSASTFKLSRMLNIYKAYLKFLDYLSSDDYPTDKNIFYLYSLTSMLYDTLLIIWEKTDNDVKLACPLYTSFTDILAGLQINPKIIMMLKDGDYYEPLELKLRNEEGNKMMQLNDYPNIKQVIAECSKLSEATHNHAANIKSKTLQYLSLLQQFTKTHIYNKKDDFYIEKVIINNDLTINKFFLRSNILLKTSVISISLLPTLIDTLGITQVVFYDDIVGSAYNIQLLKSDIHLFFAKVKEYHMHAEMGHIVLETDKEIYTKLTIPKDNMGHSLIIHADMQNSYYKYIDESEYNTKKWFQLQNMVANKLLKIYDDAKLQDLLKHSRTDIISTLLNHFKNIPENNKIQIILEELPLHTVDGIKKWLDNILLYTKYEYFSNNIKEDDKEFIFSQYHVTQSVPQRLLAYHKSLPNVLPKAQQTHFLTIQDNEKTADDRLPIIFEGIPEKLKSKWIKHKKMAWYHMTLLRRKYTKNTIQDLFEWLCKILDLHISFDDVKTMTNAQYHQVINNIDTMSELFHNTSFYNEYLTHMNVLNKTNKKFKTLQIFMDTYFLPSSLDERKKIINAIIEADNVYPNDLHIYMISRILNMSFLIIHRAKYGVFNETDKDVKRGEVEDLLHSSTFYHAKTNAANRPLLILSKEHDKTATGYYAIIEKNKNIYMQLKDAPADIRYFTDAHMQLLKDAKDAKRAKHANEEKS